MKSQLAFAVGALTFILFGCTPLKAPNFDASVGGMGGTTEGGTGGENRDGSIEASALCNDGETQLCSCGPAVGGQRTCKDGSWSVCKISCGATGSVGLCGLGERECDEGDGKGTWGECSIKAAPKDSCTGKDDDCDGKTDGDCECRINSERLCEEGGKLFGPCGAGKEICISPGKWGDCSIKPAGNDTCEEGNDNNCNGKKNENCPCIEGKTRPCSDGGLFGTCAAGIQTCKNGVFGSCSITPAAKDTCISGNDDTCNNVKNESCTCVAASQQSCSKSGARGTCATGMQTCNTNGTWGACSIAAAAKDQCVLGNDDTCDGTANGGCGCIVGDTRLCSLGGFKGTCAAGTQKCVSPGSWEAGCSIAPAAMDKCDVTGNDDTCNGTPNEGCFDPEKQTFTDPVCIYRPNHLDQHQCGPAGAPVNMSVALRTDGFCGSQYNQDGIFNVGQTRLDDAAWNQSASGTSVMVTNVGRVYLPGGQAGYDAATNGKVAISFWTSVFTNTSQNSSTYHIDNIHEYLVAQKQIPYTLVVYLADDLNGVDRIKSLKEKVLPALKATFPKISDDPAYRVIAGQSSAGGNAFDTMWMGSDIVSKGIGGSPALVCFTCMGGQGLCPPSEPACSALNDTYSREIAFCPARKVRWTGTVGGCDIYGSLAERVAAGCTPLSGAGEVDASQCKATYITANTAVANAFKAKGVPYQLFIIDKGAHAPATWGGIALAYQIRWVFKDIMCAM